MRAIVASLVLTSTVVLAQSPPPGAGLRFEVVSIKRNMTNALGSNGSSDRPDGGFTLLNVPSYRIKLQYARAFSSAGPSIAPSPDDDLPDLFSALPAQLGLKLEPSQGTREVLAVDRVERPSED